MSHQVNFNTHGKELNDAYQAVISEKDDTNWLIYAFDKGTYDLRVQATGEDGLEELNDEFSDGKVQFALAKVIDPNTELPKFVFIGWCGSGVPELRKAFFNSQLSDVSKFFKSFHVQINARDEADVDPKLIMKRVAESSGANYSVHRESAKAQSRVTPVGSVYKKTEIPDIAAMQRESMTKENAPTPVGTNYKPVQTTPKKMEQRWNQASNTTDAGANTVRAEREKFEREVREREIERSRQVLNIPPPPAAAAAAPPTPSRPNVAPPAPARPSANDEIAAARRVAQEQEAAARQQQEEEERRRYEEEEKQRQREEEEQYGHQQEEAERQRRQQEEEQRRYEEEQRRHQQEEEERQRQQEAERKRQEAEAERHRQQQEEEEAHRRRQQQEEEEAAERQRHEEEVALQAQLNQTADRAVHAAAGAAAGAATATATVAGSHLQGVSAVVLFAYDASETNEMTLFEGEVVHQIDQVDEGWWFGVSEDGKKQGLFPANYVQILELAAEEVPAHVEAPPAAPVAPPAPARPTEPEPVDEGNVAVALYDYQAEEDNEISFNEGDVITQIEFVSDDWWQGLAASGKTVGLFPANYVELKQ